MPAIPRTEIEKANPKLCCEALFVDEAGFKSHRVQVSSEKWQCRSRVQVQVHVQATTVQNQVETPSMNIR